MDISLKYDINLLYPFELELGNYALQLIKEEMDVELPESEAIGIAMNIINSEINSSHLKNSGFDEIIEECTKITEEGFDCSISRDSFNYSRFVTHFRFLLQRSRDGVTEQASDALYKTIREEYPKGSDIVDQIFIYLDTKGFPVKDAEKLYMILHVQRLISHEDCYRN